VDEPAGHSRNPAWERSWIEGAFNDEGEPMTLHPHAVRWRRRVDLRHPRLDGFGEGPTQMGGGSFVQPWEGTNRDIHFTLSSNRINLTSLTSAQPLGSTAVPPKVVNSGTKGVTLQ
jgi:hypothetical protein